MAGMRSQPLYTSVRLTQHNARRGRRAGGSHLDFLACMARSTRGSRAVRLRREEGVLRGRSKHSTLYGCVPWKGGGCTCVWCGVVAAVPEVCVCVCWGGCVRNSGSVAGGRNVMDARRRSCQCESPASAAPPLPKGMPNLPNLLNLPGGPSLQPVISSSVGNLLINRQSPHAWPSRPQARRLVQEVRRTDPRVGEGWQR